MHAANMDLRFFRTARYSGSDLPAWRMNQTGVWDTGWRRQARRKGDSLVGAVTQMIVSQPGDTPTGIHRPGRAACDHRVQLGLESCPAAGPVVREVTG